MAIRLPPPPEPAAPSPASSPPAAIPEKPIVPLKPAKREAAKPPPPPAPRPALREALKPRPRPAIPKPAAPHPKPAPVEKIPAEQTVAAAPANRKEGRVLLRLLEHGKGPAIEIAWPDAPAERERLYHRLTRCFGMQAVVIDGAERLFGMDGPAGTPWEIELDRYSGFVRAPAGRTVADERRLFTRIARRHGLSDWRPARLFPRSVDAMLLGGLARLIGPDYGSARSITAAYRLRRGSLAIDRLRVDGRPVAGSISMDVARRCRST